jgi:hypothetical protein
MPIKRKGENNKTHFLKLTLPKIKVTAIVKMRLIKGVTGSKNIDNRTMLTSMLRALMLGFISFNSIITLQMLL